MTLIFTHVTTGEKIATRTEREFSDLRIAAARKARTDGKEINTASLVWSDVGPWSCVEVDEMGRVKTDMGRVGLATKWFVPARREDSSARIDSAMDGGARSMGMLKR